VTEIERTLESLTAFAERQQAKSYGGDFYAGVAFGLEHAAAEIRRAIDFERDRLVRALTELGLLDPVEVARATLPDQRRTYDRQQKMYAAARERSAS